MQVKVWATAVVAFLGTGLIAEMSYVNWERRCVLRRDETIMKDPPI